jgi:predicted AAA+ superfamily ATPase
MQRLEILLKNQEHFMKSTGVYPVQPLKKNRSGIRRLFPLFHAIIISSLRLLNKSNKLKNSKKIYFYDNGIRNSVIANFAIPEIRHDVGALWENFLVSERKKKLEYDGLWRHTWFWRTSNQKEIDYIEEGDGAIQAFEFTWNPSATYKTPTQFLKNYASSEFTVISPDNMEAFLL